VLLLLRLRRTGDAADKTWEKEKPVVGFPFQPACCAQDKGGEKKEGIEKEASDYGTIHTSSRVLTLKVP